MQAWWRLAEIRASERGVEEELGLSVAGGAKR